MVAISIMTTAWPELPAYGCWTYEVVEQHQHWSHEERETQEKYANFRNASVVVTSTATVDTGINSANRETAKPSRLSLRELSLWGYMDLGFLRDYLPLSISGRAGWYGPKGQGTNTFIPGNRYQDGIQLRADPSNARR